MTVMRLDSTPQRLSTICGLIMLNRTGLGALQVLLPVLFWTVLGSKIAAFASFGILYLPYVVGPVIGLCVDALDKKRSLWMAEITQSLAILAVALCLNAELHFWTMMFLLLFGIANLFSRSITEFSLLPAISLQMKHGRSQKLYWTAVNFGYFIGPAVAGVVLSLQATNAFFGLYAIATTVTVLIFARIEIIWPSNRSAALRLDSLSDGVRAFRDMPALQALTLVLFLYNLGVGALPTVIVFSLLNDFSVSNGSVGFLTSLMALSSVVGSLLSDTKLRGRQISLDPPLTHPQSKSDSVFGPSSHG